ncbi:MAG: YhcH/YjgK/YiaL family protein [Bacteroidota bacterium]
MISDSIKNRHFYWQLSPRIRMALDYLGTTDFPALEPGRYDVDGDRIFALVQEYDTIPMEMGKWECHQQYIDIQYIVKGIEQIGFVNRDALKVVTEYNPEHDIAFLKGKGDYATFTEGGFGIFFPHDAHQPKVAPGNKSGQVKKVVVKILAS